LTLRFELGHKIMPIRLAPARAACGRRARGRQQPLCRPAAATRGAAAQRTCSASSGRVTPQTLICAARRGGTVSAPRVRRVAEAHAKPSQGQNGARAALTSRRLARTNGTLGAAAAAHTGAARHGARREECARRLCAIAHRPAAPAATCCGMLLAAGTLAVTCTEPGRKRGRLLRPQAGPACERLRGVVLANGRDPPVLLHEHRC
jgi:hypothetical protein